MTKSTVEFPNVRLFQFGSVQQIWNVPSIFCFCPSCCSVSLSTWLPETLSSTSTTSWIRELCKVKQFISYRTVRTPCNYVLYALHVLFQNYQMGEKRKKNTLEDMKANTRMILAIITAGFKMSCLSGYDMSTFIRRYSRYLNEKAMSYRLVAVDFTKMKRG